MRKTLLWLWVGLSAGAAFAQNNNQRSDKQLTDATVSRAKIESHIGFLASDELRGRQTPSPELNIAAKYLATQLRSYGVKPTAAYPDYLQPVAMKTVSAPTEVTVAYNDKTFRFVENTLMLEGDKADLNADAVFLNFGTEAEFAKANVKGKIVFVKAGLDGQTNPQAWYMAGQEKRKRAADKGALALVEFYSNQQLPWKLLVNYFKGGGVTLDNSAGKPAQTPHLWMHDPDWKEAAFWAANKQKTKAQVKIGGITEDKFTTYNVVGYIEGTDSKLKDEYVTYSAHYDHVGVGKPDAEGDTIYNGARDNAVGSVTVLAAAENMGRHPTKRSALFVLFTGEEKGLLGSEWFVEHSPVEMKKIVYCFNSDNAGYNDTSLVTLFGLTRTTAEPYIKQAAEAYGLKAIEDPAPEQGLFDRSDNVNFAKKGVPAPTFSMGFTSFSGTVTKFYHQAADGPATLDYDYLFKFFSSYVYACRLIANAPERPFWKPGDKYYEAGKKLYGK